LKIPFVKAHGSGNDFLLTWWERAPSTRLPAVARAICDRHTGIGGDGWMLVKHDAIRLFNADGSEPELSGNGTRCAAAMLVDAGIARTEVHLNTGAGLKTLSLIERHGYRFLFEMDMGQPKWDPDQVRYRLESHEVTIVNVGNPQCVLFADAIPSDWEQTGAIIEAHPFFHKRTNVSFVHVVDEHTLDVRFFERGVGPTLSSGTGSTGAAVAAMLRGVVRSPVRIGEITVRWDDSVYLTGPAEIVGAGEFYAVGQD
jgi:diaminopimelate epimerase